MLIERRQVPLYSHSKTQPTLTNKRVLSEKTKELQRKLIRDGQILTEAKINLEKEIDHQNHLLTDLLTFFFHTGKERQRK